MQFLQNIKFNYYKNQLEDLYKSSKYEQLFKILKELQTKDKNLYQHFSAKYLNLLLKNIENGNLLNNKIYWINSFDLEDTIYLQNFIKSYFSSIYEHEFHIKYFNDQIFNLINNSAFDQKLDFNSFLNLNYLVQYDSLNRNDGINFMINNFAFYEAENAYLFTHPKLTLGYSLLIKNPIMIYQSFKEKSEAQESMNNLLNLDNRNLIISKNETSIEVNRQGWPVFNQSWMNENTKNTFNGNLIKLEELNTNLEDQLTQIIFHMQQCGIEIDIDYSFIKEYSANNLYKLDILENNKFSNKELKLLRSSVAELNTDLKYSI